MRALTVKNVSKIGQPVLFGLMFGFLLQKGGVAKYHVLEGQLLLRDYTVLKVMLSAILVGMIGVYFLHERVGTKLHLKPTKLGANILGGLIFGVGFALAGYCPGTGAAALGQGDLPVIIVMLGLVVGSYGYAELSRFLKTTVETWGDLGKRTLPSVLGMKPSTTVAAVAVLLSGVLFIIHSIQH
jgi:uncharacterized protein